MNKTDWNKYLDKTDKIRYNFKTNNEIKNSSIRHFCKTFNLTANPDTIADLNKLIKLQLF